MKLFSRSLISLGDGNVRALTIFEHKRLFSIIIYSWNTVDQLRFHSHAFNSIAILLSGGYTQAVIHDGKITQNDVFNRFIPRFLPRNYTHSILRSKPATRSLVFTGPWQKTWWEFFPSRASVPSSVYSVYRYGVHPAYWQEYTWGRKKLRRIWGSEQSHGFIMKHFK